MTPLQESAAQHTERERVVRKPILQVCAFCGKRQFLAQVTEPQALVNALQELVVEASERQPVAD